MSDYGRDENGRYTGNTQRPDPWQLGGETQATICEWALEHEIRTGRSPLFDDTLGVTPADLMIRATIHLAESGRTLLHEMNVRMAELRDPEWAAARAARKAAGGAH